MIGSTADYSEIMRRFLPPSDRGGSYSWAEIKRYQDERLQRMEDSIRNRPQAKAKSATPTNPIQAYMQRHCEPIVAASKRILANEEWGSDPWNKSLAIHEAGHLIVAKMTGANVHSASIQYDGSGSVIFNYQDATPLGRVAIGFSGAAAARELAGYDGQPSPEDWSIIHKAVADGGSLSEGRDLATNYARGYRGKIRKFAAGLHHARYLDRHDIEFLWDVFTLGD